MYREQDLKRLVGIGSLLGLGWILLVFTVVRSLQSDTSVFYEAVGLAIPIALLLTVSAGIVGIVLYGLQSWSFRIAAWTCLGTLAIPLAVILNILGLDFVRPDFTLALYMITTAAAGGATLGFLIGLYDAHQTRVQEHLVAKRDEAKTLSQRLSVLNRVLRHDIRTQTQLIQGYTDRLSADEITQQTATDGIRQANQRLVNLSDEARQLQQIFDGDEIESRPTDLVALIRDVGQTIQETHPNLGIAFDMPDEQVVYAPPLLKQALSHVMQNIVEHTDTEEPQARISVQSETTPQHTVELRIADNGPGIPDPELIHTSEETESPLHHSQGVGLWLVTWIIEEADGDLDIETPATTGTGTVLTITLPAPES